VTRRRLFDATIRDPLPIIKSVLSDSSPVKEKTLNAISSSYSHPTGSWRFDPPGSGVKSTQQLHIDFSKFENHVFFNSARAKVNMAFDKIINRYPFDGSKEEVQEFIDGLNGFERYVFERIPSSIGSLAFLGSQYINVSDRSGVLFPSLSRKKEGLSVVDPKEGSFCIDFQIFVPKNVLGATARKPILHKVNEAGDVGLTVYMKESDAFGTAPSGSLSILLSDGISSLSSSMEVEKGTFDHVSINVARSGKDTQISMFRNGKLTQTSEERLLNTIDTKGAPLLIGSASSHAADVIEGGKLQFASSEYFSGSLDELRIFHKTRTEHEINYSMDSNVYSSDYLKLYYKFNEPSGSHGGSDVVLDSSGNSLHARIEGYQGVCRGLRGSGLAEEDPILSPVLFPSHVDLIDLNKSLLFTASRYDDSNPNVITRLVPTHYLKEAQIDQALSTFDGGVGDPYGTSLGVPGSGKISQPQIISSLLFTWASLFDDLKLFVQTLGDVEFISLVKSGTVPDQFLIDKAERMGFPLPDLYSNASLSQFLFAASTQKEKGLITKSLNSVQNEVWRRVLSDLPEIMRSKGTIHSVETFLRNVGIEPNGLFRLREYGGSRKIYLGRERLKRKEVTPFLNFTSSYNNFSPAYDANNMSTNFQVVKSPFLIASRSEPGTPQITEHHNLAEYYVARGKEYGSADNLVALFRYSSGSSGKVSHPNHDVGLTLKDVTGFVSPLTASAHQAGAGVSVGHGIITGSISPKIKLEFAEYPDGQAQYGEIPDNDSLSFGSGALSVSMWVQFSTGHPGNDKLIIKKSTEYTVKFDASGDLTYTLVDSAGGSKTMVVSADTPSSHYLFDGRWHMITLTHEGGGGNNGVNTGKMRIYIDGSLEATGGTVSGGNFSQMRNTGNNLFIAYEPGGGNTGCKVNLADLALWSASLDATTVEAVYNSYRREEDKEKIGPDLPHGLLTSGSWGYEGWYKFRPFFINGKPRKMPITQSLVRMYTTGSSVPSSKGGLIGNLVLRSGSDDAGHSLVLHMRPNVSGDLFSLALTGVNCFNGDPWQVSFGRARNDLTGSAVSSSYYLRAGSVSNGKLSGFVETIGGYKDNSDYSAREDQRTSLFSSGSKELNSSGTFFVIGDSQITNVSNGGLFLHNQNFDEETRVTKFKGQLGPIRFYSKEITLSETKEHIKNFRSVGVENPHRNFNFNIFRTGSFERLRLDAHLDQEDLVPDGNGFLEFVDFSNNKNEISVTGLDPKVSPFDHETMQYSIPSPYIDRSVTSSKVRVRGYKSRDHVKKYHYSQFSPVYDVNPYEENLDDNRFAVEVSSVQGLNEDIMNILGTMDSIEDAIGKPNLVFASEYSDLSSLRETYFKRLTAKVNYKEFFEFFKWFDRSIGGFIDYLLPSKTNFLGTNFIIESHFLERHKYRYYFDDIYLGESDRDGLKGEIRLQLITGSIKRL